MGGHRKWSGPPHAPLRQFVATAAAVVAVDDIAAVVVVAAVTIQYNKNTNTIIVALTP